MFVIGLISWNPRILGPALPFLVIAAATVRQHQRKALAS